MKNNDFISEVAELYDIEEKYAAPNQLKLGSLVSEHVVGSFKDRDLEAERLRILARAKNLVNKVFLKSELEAVDKAATECVRDYFFAAFSSNYDTLSPELFDLQRVISIDFKSKPHNIKIPVFAHSRFGAVSDWRYRVTEGRNEIIIVSKHPPYTDEVKVKAREAFALWGESYAQLFRTPIVGDFLINNREIVEESKLEMNVYWIPKSSELNITVRERDPDPILVGKLSNKHYLIAQWDILGEEPYQHYLEEYKNP